MISASFDKRPSRTRRATSSARRLSVLTRFRVSEKAIHNWGREGLIRKCYSDNLTRGLWEVPADQKITKGCGGRGARPARREPITAPLAEQGAV